MVRKPDPPVLVAITKEPTGRLKTTVVQILDYNLNRCATVYIQESVTGMLIARYRFDIDDRKGLEIVILTTLLTFQDANEAAHTPRDEGSSSGLAMGIRRMTSTASQPVIMTPPPPPPPKPAPKTGIDRIAEMQAARGEYNEIAVEDEGSIEDYAQYCLNLLEV